MKKSLLLAIMSACLGAGINVYAQNPGRGGAPPQTPSDPQQAPAQSPADSGDASPLTVVGCLVKATGDHLYTITDKKSGEKLNFSATNAIDQFLNQTVQLTGRVTAKGGEKSFIPQTAKSLSPSCDAPQ